MKKTILFAIMMMAVCSANAQLTIDSLGIAYITHGTYRSHNAYFNMNGPNELLYCYMQANTNETFVPAGEFFSTNDGTGKILGLSAVGWGNNNNDYAIGIRGKARALNGRGVGTFGCLSTRTNKGAGILGSNNLLGYSYIDSLYAGFFNGLTKVRGNLIVTGNIQGTILGAPASPSGMSPGGETEGCSVQIMTNHLKGLTANTYYHKLSDETLKAINTNNTKSESLPIDYDNLTDEEIMAMEEAELNANDHALPELSTIEKQILTKQHYGLNADQLEEVFPDLVYEDEKGSKSINYVEMVPILVQAINELKSELDELKGNGGEVKKAQTRAASSDGMGDNLVMLSLGQNKPNPFGTTTSIDVCIPESVQKAFIYVYNLQGKKIDQVDITARGKQTIQLNAATLSDGMYLYSLIADGKVIETRRMIVEK